LFFLKENFKNKMEFNEKEYIKNVVKELNKNCQTPKTDKYEWEIDDLKLELDNFCRYYCWSTIDYDGNYKNKLCQSCREILEEKIRKPFNRTPFEINMAINKILGLF
jgi:hypothetical protein